MATLAVSDLSSETGGALALVAAAAGGDEFAWSEDTWLVVENGGGGAVNVTLAAQSTTADVKNFGTMSRGNIVIAVANDSIPHLIPPPPAAFKDSQSPRMVQVAYSDATSVTVGAFAD